MRITCYYDDYFDMGYIYLRQAEDEFDAYISNKNEIGEYLSPEEINIPYITEDASVPFFLDQMTIPQQTFRADYEKKYETEYGNDFDREGYITGIELGLQKERFLELIQKEAFKVIRTEWRNKNYHLITFDSPEAVFDTENVIYKLSDKEDAFVIVKLENPKNLGIQYYYSTQDPPIALIKALLSARDDMYPIPYILQPLFHLEKGKGLSVINNDLTCELDGLSTWSSFSQEKQENLLNNYFCENCSEVVAIEDCTIHKEPDGLLLRGKCNSCKHRVSRFVEKDNLL